MNSITKFAVKYPVSVLMLTLAVCLLGTISYNKLGTDLFPDLKNPALYVEVKSPPPAPWHRRGRCAAFMAISTASIS